MNVDERQRAVGEMRVHAAHVGRNPHSAFAVALSAMAVTVVGASVVGGYNHHPLLIEVGFAIFHGVPNLLELGIGALHIIVHKVAVAIEMESRVGVPQIHPREVGGIGADTFGSFFAHQRVDVENVQFVLFGPEVDGVEFKSVGNIVDFQVAGLRFALADEHGAIVHPAREQACGEVAFLLLGNAEQCPVVVVRVEVGVSVHVVLVHPCSGEDVGVTDG